MEAPFIHLLRSPYACYFFDVNTNRLVMVSEEAYAALKGVTQTGIIPPTISENCRKEIQKLYSEGYLKSKRIKEIEHPLSKQLGYILDRKIRKITLQLTQSCNLRCAYCIYSDTTNERQRKHSGKRMSWETAKAGIDYFAQHSIDSDKVNVGFYGGEPLLEFDLLKKATLYAEERFEGRDFSINLTSNATLLSDEVLDFFAEHDIGLLVSLDGPKSIHDRSRCFANGGGTFDTVMANMENAIRKYPEYAKKLGVNMVVDPQNDYDCLNEFIMDYDVFQTISAQASVMDLRYSDTDVTFSEQYLDEYNYDKFLGFLSHLKKIKNMEVPPLVQNDITRLSQTIEMGKGKLSGLPDAMMHAGPCIPGQNRLFINADGNFYPCERVSELSEAMKIGSLKEGMDVEKAKKLLNVGQLTPDSCTNCWAICHCTMCARSADDGNELSVEMKAKQCSRVRQTVESQLRTEIMFREIKGGLVSGK